METSLKGIHALLPNMKAGQFQIIERDCAFDLYKNLAIDGRGYRTARINEVIQLLDKKNSDISVNKNGTNVLDLNLTLEVIPDMTPAYIGTAPTVYKRSVGPLMRLPQ